jgi:hypothetical protein
MMPAVRVARARSEPAPERSAAGSAGGDEGTAARELSLGIVAALRTLGQGFLEPAANEALRAALREQVLSPEGYLRELIALVYRCVLILAALERGSLHPSGSTAEARRRCALSLDQGASCPTWSSLRAVFAGLCRGEPQLALPALGGIFTGSHCPWLGAAELDDALLARAWAALGGGARSAIAWSRLAPELLGSAYESLLTLRPAIASDAGGLAWTLGDEQTGGGRRRTGSYYTPEHLVQAVLDRALEPLVQSTCAAHPQAPARALAGLALVDPACGAGYFLLAAARRLARHLARRAPPGDALCDDRAALRHVLTACMFGVDLDPLAVEICRLSSWLEAGDASLPLTAFRVVQGHSLLGATEAQLKQGVPNAAWRALPGDDRRRARSLELRNRQVPPDVAPAGAPAAEQQLADGWCAAFLWPEEHAEAAPTNDLWLPAWRARAELPPATRRVTAELAARHSFFHWHLEFPEVFARGGFDLVLGNPPWIAHAGRASQRLPARVKRFYEHNYASFAEYPTTHGMFVYLAARVLREGGYLGLVIPSSLSELGGYTPTRVAHDQLCEFPDELVDFGEGQFAGVTQPCMALVSRRCAGGRGASAGQPWPMQRADLSPPARALIARLAALPPLPPELFGERGVQSDRELLQHFLETRAPSGRFDTPIREGTDVREFELLEPRWHVDRSALGARMRTADEFRRVGALVRQTARYPIAALSDGLAFRNSLLAVFEGPGWPAAALVPLLNSALIRWLHYMRFRDARQPILPQLKIAHLRALPAPPGARAAERLLRAGVTGKARSQLEPRRAIDALVFELYQLDADERALVTSWHAESAPRPRAVR